MKVIDLLNKSANKEVMPKKIKRGFANYEYDEKQQDYICKLDNMTLYLFGGFNLAKELNDEIEIIEEDISIVQARVIFNYNGDY